MTCSGKIFWISKENVIQLEQLRGRKIYSLLRMLLTIFDNNTFSFFRGLVFSVLLNLSRWVDFLPLMSRWNDTHRSWCFHLTTWLNNWKHSKSLLYLQRPFITSILIRLLLWWLMWFLSLLEMQNNAIFNDWVEYANVAK